MGKEKTDSKRGQEKKADERFEEKEDGLNLSYALKKVFGAGLTAAFMTEESLRSLLSDVRIPKETLNLLLSQANKSKQEIVNKVSREAVGLLSRIDIVKEVSKFVESHKFIVSAEIEVKKKLESENVDSESKIKDGV